MANGTFLGIDTATLGRWIGKFGAGYWSAKTYNGVLPSWLTSTVVSSASTGTITLSNTDNYFQIPGSSDSNTYTSLTSCNIDLTLVDSKVYVRSIFILSSTSPRQLTFKLQNTAGDTTYSSYTDPTPWSSQGKWYRFVHWGGSCRIRIESVSGVVTLCGVVFDKFDNQFGHTCEE